MFRLVFSLRCWGLGFDCLWVGRMWNLHFVYFVEFTVFDGFCLIFGFLVFGFYLRFGALGFLGFGAVLGVSGFGVSGCDCCFVILICCDFDLRGGVCFTGLKLVLPGLLGLV